MDADALRLLQHATSDLVLIRNQRTIRLLEGSVFTKDDFEEFSTNIWDSAFCAFENAIP